MGDRVPWVAPACRDGLCFHVTVPSVLAHGPTESGQGERVKRCLAPKRLLHKAARSRPPPWQTKSPAPTPWAVPLHVTLAIVASALAVL